MKNFVDTGLDTLVTNAGGITVLSAADSWAGKVLDGIPYVRGDLVCFLDDDDRFAASKLTEIEVTFKRRERLCFFHNSFSVIDGQGRRLTGSVFPRPSHDLYSDPASVTDSGLGELFQYRPDFNASCITVSRAILSKAIPYLLRVTRNFDGVLFFTAVAAGGEIGVGARALTEYRLHSSTSNLSGPIASFIQKQIAWESAYEASLDVILELHLPPAGIRLVEADHEYTRLILGLLSSNHRSVTLVKRAIRFSLTAKDSSLSRLRVLLLFTAHLTSPMLGQRVYYMGKIARID